MRLCSVVLCLFALLLTTTICRSVHAQTGFNQGGYEYETIDKGSKDSPDLAFAPWHFRVFAPLTTKPFSTVQVRDELPVFVFVSAFAGQVAVDEYDTVLGWMASHGVVVIACDRPTSVLSSARINTLRLGAQLNRVLDYVQDESQGLKHDMQTNQGFTRPGFRDPAIDQVYIGGHGTGAAVAIQRIRNVGETTRTEQQDGTCSDIKGVIMFSPIDSPSSSEEIVQPRRELDFVVPGVITAGALDGTSVETTGLSCAPSSRSGGHFYGPWRGAAYMFEAPRVGHLDILDEDSETVFDELCFSGQGDRDDYRRATAGAAATFIFGVEDQSTNLLGEIASQRALGIDDASTKSKTGESGGLFQGCVWDLAPEPIAFELYVGLILFGVMFGVTCSLGLYVFISRLNADEMDDWLVKLEPNEDKNGYSSNGNGSSAYVTQSQAQGQPTPSFNIPPELSSGNSFPATRTPLAASFNSNGQPVQF